MPLLGLLLDAGRTLAQGRDARDTHGGAARVLALLEEELSTVSGLVVLRTDDGAFAVEAATGLTGGFRKLRYAPGEGITGRVGQTGKPIVVPQASKEPLYLDRTGILRAAVKKRRDLSFLCVPIPGPDGPEGALAVALVYEPGRDLAPIALALEILSSLLSPRIRARRAHEEEKSRLVSENQKLRSVIATRGELSNLVGNSRPMREVYELVAQAAPTGTTVLLRGESGTGKELLANAIHFSSPRAGKPFIKVSCGALPETLIESELFGHEAGAFTDARGRKPGRFELAHGGTLFLDEVGELSMATQVKLLRVLQERTFERVGGTAPVKIDVRLIAATNKDLESAVAGGGFREDLYYRLNVFGIFVPPLRERKPDILLLADHFVEKYAAQHGRDVRRISTAAIDVLMSYHFPGNVRELENCIERAVLVCDAGVLHPHHLPPTLQTAETSGTLPRQSLESAVAGLEKDLILDALKIARGNRTKAARLLHTTERILAYKARKYGVPTGRVR